MTHSNQKGPIRRVIDAVKAGVKAFRESAPLQEPAAAAEEHGGKTEKSDPIWKFPTIGKQQKPAEKAWVEAGPPWKYLEFPRPVDSDLFRAIEAGDTNAVRTAVLGGADLKATIPYAPMRRIGDCCQMDIVTPLGYAMKIGNEETIALLREFGAKE